MTSDPQIRADFLLHISSMINNAKRLSIMTEDMDNPEEAHKVRQDLNAITLRLHALKIWVSSAVKGAA